MKVPQLLLRKKSALDEEIDRAISKMAKMNVASDQYGVAAENLKQLYEAKSLGSKWTVSPDTLAAIAANLVGILLILNYEKVGIITTKATMLLPKGRI